MKTLEIGSQSPTHCTCNAQNLVIRDENSSHSENEILRPSDASVRSVRHFPDDYFFRYQLIDFPARPVIDQ